MSCHLKGEQDLGRRQIGRRVPGRQYKRGKKAVLVRREGGRARSGGTCLHVDGAGAEDVKWSTHNRVEAL